MTIIKMYENENGYVYPSDHGYKIYWKNEKVKPNKDMEFSKYHEAYHYLRSVNKMKFEDREDKRVSMLV